MTLLEILSFSFVQRALIAGIFVALLTACLGVFLVLKRLSLLGDSLSHIALSGIALGLFLQITPLFTAIPVVMLSSLGIYKISKNKHIYTDSALGIIASAGIALGLIIASLAGGFNTDLMSFLFGNILTVTWQETFLSIFVFLIIIACLYFFYNSLIAIIFDENFAKTSGIKVDLINIILVLLSSLAIVIAIKVAGIMLVSSLIILPPVSALQIAKNFRSVLFYACGFSVFSVIVGIFLAFYLNLPPSALIICLDLFILCFCLGIKHYANKKTRNLN